MFLLNVGYKWNWASTIDEVRGVIYLASGNDAQRMSRKSIPEYNRSMFDPQLYLSSLDASRCAKVCSRLASYSWFSVPDVPRFDSGESSRHQWNARMREHVTEHWPHSLPESEDAVYNACSDCIQQQIDISCTHIILPSPLMTEREDEAEQTAMWLDQSIQAANEWEVGQPVLATVALHESTLNERAFDANGFLDTIVDQVTSREGVDGVYLVIMQSQSAHPFETLTNVNRAYLYLSKAFAEHFATVIVNFADVFGVVCLAGSATSVATGQSLALRRLSMDMSDSAGRRALPHFYSHPAIWEPFTERDLDVCVSRGCFPRIRDTTRVSRPLMDELARSGSASNLPAWAEQQSNLSAATQHFLLRVSSVIDGLASASIPDRIDSVSQWLDSAIARQSTIRRRFGDMPIHGKMAPADEWLDIFSGFFE